MQSNLKQSFVGEDLVTQVAEAKKELLANHGILNNLLKVEIEQNLQNQEIIEVINMQTDELLQG